MKCYALKRNCLLFLFFLTTFLVRSQNEVPETGKASLLNKLSLDAEYRPRAELRRGYRNLPTDTSDVAFLISHRARINLRYKDEGFQLYASLQDVRIWGDTDPRSTEGSVQVYEFYVEPRVYKNWYARVGRQKVTFDDERLFAENEWRQTGSQHDAVRLFYKGSKVRTDFLGAFNQNKDQLFGTQYDISWDMYKVLLANFIEVDITKSLSFTGINFGDAYTDPATDDVKSHWKYTHGGRLTYKTPSWNFIFAGYYQYGKIDTGERLDAFYLQPEIKYSGTLKYSARLGMQLFSGDNNPNDGVSHSFLAQYGAFHRYNGRMDYTQKTVRTYNHEGIINPYLIQDYKLNGKCRLNWESHILATQQTLTDDFGNKLNKMYAWENDFRVIYTPNRYTQMDIGYLCMIAGKTLEYLPTGAAGNSNTVPQFAYVQVRWTPTFLN